MNIKTKFVIDHYEIYVNDKFYCSCEESELTDSINEAEKEGEND